MNATINESATIFATLQYQKPNENVKNKGQWHDMYTNAHHIPRAKPHANRKQSFINKFHICTHHLAIDIDWK